MTNNQQLPIIIPVDELTHTPEWTQCKDATCPCQDEIILTFPTEEQLDAQERSVLSHGDEEPVTGGPRTINWNYIFE